MTNSDKPIVILNTLIQINNDRKDGYNHAYEDTDEEDLKTLFQDLAATSIRCNDELSEQVSKLGGTPTTGTTTSGKFYRMWMDVKAAITSKDRKAILESCEYGEDWAVKTYKNVIADDLSEVSEEQAQMIRDQFQWIKSDHDKIKNLRDAVPA